MRLPRLSGPGAGGSGVLRAAPALLVNLTRPGVLERYVDSMWPGLVVLNEVYPPPPAQAVEGMRRRGVAVHHLSGVAGWALPAFGGAYAGAIPCCAAHITEGLEVRIARLA